MALGSFEAVQNWEHDSQFRDRIFPALHILHSELVVDLIELVGHALALSHDLDELILLKHLRIAFWCQTHKVLFDVVDIHVALSQQVASLVDITLDEESYYQLV